MDYITITAEDIANAKVYLTQLEKAQFIDIVATNCFDRVNITAGENSAEIALPPMYKENTFMKARYLMGMLVRSYLGREFEPVEGDGYLMSQDDYDRYAGGHIINQIERFKSNAELRDKCFDLLYDYRDLEKRLNTEIYGLLQCMNDSTTRLLTAMSGVANENIMQNSLDELKTLQEEIKNFAEEHTTLMQNEKA